MALEESVSLQSNVCPLASKVVTHALSTPELHRKDLWTLAVGDNEPMSGKLPDDLVFEYYK
jgi:hypothetical protein